MTWKIERNRFKHTEQSAVGSLINESQKEWLNSLDDKSREMFVNTLFSFFEATGMDTFDEMIVNRRASVGKILATIRNLPKEKRSELKTVMGGLMHSTRQVVMRRIRDIRKRGRRVRILKQRKNE